MTDGPFPPNSYHPMAWISGDPTIGQGTWIGAFTVIDGSGGLTIGSGVDVSCGAQIYTHSTARRCVSARGFETIDREPTTIGDHVFIGANAVINMGVRVGDHAVIGAGAVVTADVAPNSIVAGVPARRIGTVQGEGADVRFEHDAPGRASRPTDLS